MNEGAAVALRRRMGIMYYLTPWRREAARNQLKVLAALEHEMELQDNHLPVSSQNGGSDTSEDRDHSDYVYEYTAH